MEPNPNFWGYNGPCTMGDILYTPNDPYISSTGSTSISQGPYSGGNYTDSLIVTWRSRDYMGGLVRNSISRFVFPLTSITQTNWTVQKGYYDTITHNQ